MKKRTTHKSFLHRFLLITLMGVGLIPLFYFVSVEVQVAEASADDSSATTTLADVLDRPIDNMAFGEGEKLSFDINYGFINAGTATMEVKRLIEYKGRPCYEIVTRANSNRFFSTVYKVEDRVESIIDAVGIFTWRFEKNLREGSYKSNRVCTFDQRQHVVLYKDDTTEVAPFV
ncbi:MAG: DUF3108 domain-containing protein, partial [candidate division Zixibacteria bacterium]|nr:DUF3108 domain-containing protein [candidate division Zixibacteria bacterium]